MSTPAQIAANQANSKLSTGATSEAGKKIVSQNSWKHGLCAKLHIALPGEQDALEEHVEGYLEAYAPVGLPERDLVRNIAENHFRLQRAHALEHALFNQIVVQQSANVDTSSADDEAWLAKTRELKNITRPGRTHSTCHRKEHRRVERHAGPAKVRLRQSSSRSDLTHPTRACQRRNGGRRERLPVPRALRWLCLFTTRNRSPHRSRRPPGGGQRPLPCCVGPAFQPVEQVTSSSVPAARRRHPSPQGVRSPGPQLFDNLSNLQPRAPVVSTSRPPNRSRPWVAAAL